MDASEEKYFLECGTCEKGKYSDLILAKFPKVHVGKQL